MNVKIKENKIVCMIIIIHIVNTIFKFKFIKIVNTYNKI